MTDLPFLTAALPSIGGQFRLSPEDFRVEEISAYEPSGEGEHLYVRFEKRGLATPAAVRAMADALGVDPREAGYAGLKDRHAVTVQTASFARADAGRAMELALPGIRVLEARRHGNKLRTGHLHGNRFVVVVRDCVPGAEQTARAVAEALRCDGVPNYYGEQRFGRDGDNAARGRAWLTGAARPPREAFLRKLWVSAVQSELFNRYLAARLSDGLLARYVPGDLAVRHPLARWFAIEPAEAEATYASRACSATGPMFGRTMRWPEGEARAREEQVLADSGLALEDFARARDLGEGTRRPVRMVLDRLEVTASAGTHGVDLALEFVLPAGGYATAVLREFRKTDEERLQSDDRLGIEAGAADEAEARVGASQPPESAPAPGRQD